MSLEITERDDSEDKNVSNAQEGEKLNNSELSQQVQGLQKQLEELQKKGVSGGNESETMNLLKEVLLEIKGKPDSEKYGGEGTYVDNVDIDEEDWIDEGVPFFCHKVMYAIVDDMRNGHPVQTPYKNRIFFKYQYTRKVPGNGKEDQLHNLSVYVSHSNKEVEWLKKHTYFGSIFFLSHPEAMTIDVIKANKLAKHMMALTRMGSGKVITMAQSMGIANNKDIESLRIAIANNLADKEMTDEKAANALRVKEAIMEQDNIPQ